MKKTYLTPAIDVQKFDVADIITASEVRTPTDSATIVGDGAGNNSVEIVAKW